MCPSAAAYDAVVPGLIHRSAALDRPNVKFLARLSPRYPTVEVRVADVCLDLDDAVLLAGLVRALVTTAIEEAEDGVPVRAVSARRIEAAILAAARHGLDGPGLDPWSGARAAQRSLLDRLLGHVWGTLARSGDDQEITALVGRLDQRGTGAVRQRALRASGPPRASWPSARPGHPRRLRRSGRAVMVPSQAGRAALGLGRGAVLRGRCSGRPDAEERQDRSVVG